MLQKFCPRVLEKELWTRNLLLNHTLLFERRHKKERYSEFKRQLDAHEYYLWFRYGLPPIFVTKTQWIEKIQNTSSILHDPRKKFFISSQGNIHSIEKNKIVYPISKTIIKTIQFPVQISKSDSLCICSISNARYLQSLVKVL